MYIKMAIQRLERKRIPAPEELFDYYYLAGRFAANENAIRISKRYHKKKHPRKECVRIPRRR